LKSTAQVRTTRFLVLIALSQHLAALSAVAQITDKEESTWLVFQL